MMMKPLAPRPSSSSVNRITCLIVLLFGLLSAMFSACAQTPTPTVESIQFSIIADTSTAPLMDELVTAYSDERPNVTINLEHAPNAERALDALQEGQADLATVSWLPENHKVEGNVWYQPYARDSLVVIAHATNPIGGLTLLQLRGVFLGQSLSWQELGGLAVDVKPVSREEGSGTRLSFESLVMGRHDVTPIAVMMPSNEAVVEYVAATPGAIGYIASAWLAPNVNLLAIEGVTPSPASVKDGRYLLARAHYLAAIAEPTGGVAEFVDWIREGEGQTLVKSGYAPAP
jgi:phosphate transport system substrate-binding protein